MQLWLMTAPSERVYEELEIAGPTGDYAKPRLLDPKSLDVDMQLWSGDRSIVLRAMQMRIGLPFEGITSAQAEQLEKWKHNRSFLRINGNYGARTIWYQSFQRLTYDNLISPQIGLEPAFDRDESSGYGKRTYLGDDGLLYPVGDDIPRVEPAAWDMKGILLEDDTRNAVGKSHPTSGSLNWASHAGSPSLFWTTDMQSNVYGEAGCLYVVGATNDAVKHTSQPLIGDFIRSYSVYIKGHGQIHIEVYNDTATTSLKTGTTVTLDPENWQRLTVVNFSGAGNGHTLSARIWFDTNAHFWIAGDQIENKPFASSYIHNPTWTGTPLVDVDQLDISGLKGLSAAGSFSFGFQHFHSLGENHTSPLHFLLADAGENFELYFDASTDKFYFQKKSVSKRVEYVTTKAENDPIILTGCYDEEYIEIWEDGVRKDQLAYGYSIHSVPGTLYMWGQVSHAAWGAPIMFARIDNAKLPDSEIQRLADFYTDANSRIWTNRCEGRDFIIERMSVPLRVGPGTWDCAVQLHEVAAKETATLRKR